MLMVYGKKEINNVVMTKAAVTKEVLWLGVREKECPNRPCISEAAACMG
jgi:hypothetical protein